MTIGWTVFKNGSTPFSPSKFNTMRNYVKTKDGSNAGNRYGSCGVLALAAIKGMKYEDATAWAIKNNMFSKLVNGEVSGMDIMKGGGFATFKKLGAKGATRHYPKAWKNAGTETDAEYKERLGLTQLNYDRCKVETFAKKHPRGRHMLVTKDHALACIHGEIYHNGGKWNFTNQLVQYSVEF